MIEIWAIAFFTLHDTGAAYTSYTWKMPQYETVAECNADGHTAALSLPPLFDTKGNRLDVKYVCVARVVPEDGHR